MFSRLTKFASLTTLLLAAACGDSEETIQLQAQPGDEDQESSEANGGSGGDSNSESTAEAGSGSASDNDENEGTQTISGAITEDTQWDAETLYTLEGIVFVENNATLTIAPGTRIVGNGGSALVITRGSQIDAEGTADDPIVFSSSQSEGSRSSNDWGGLVLLGSAPNNIAAPTIEGIDPAEDASRIAYGGNEPDSNCGILRYVRIEFAGFEFAGDNELNGLSVGSCGRATQLEYIQVHLGSDDGIEMFGGTADLKHIVISGAEDDSLDWDQGWRGRGQFIVIQHRNSGSDAGFESDNNENDNDLMPRSLPTLSNLTLVGGAGSSSPGMVLRRGTHAMIYNAIITGFPAGAVDIRDGSSVAGATGGSLFLSNSIFFNNGGNGDENFPTESGDDDNDNGFDEADFFTDAALGNRLIDPQLGDSASRTAPDFMPAAASPAATEAATPPNGEGFFDTTATYVGAMEPGGNDWTQGWTDYPRD